MVWSCESFEYGRQTLLTIARKELAWKQQWIERIICGMKLLIIAKFSTFLSTLEEQKSQQLK